MGLKHSLILLLLLCANLVSAEGLSYTFAEGKLGGTQAVTASARTRGLGSSCCDSEKIQTFTLHTQRLRTQLDVRTCDGSGGTCLQTANLITCKVISTLRLAMTRKNKLDFIVI
jgi:hypothetical protein